MKPIVIQGLRALTERLQRHIEIPEQEVKYPFLGG